MLSTASTAVFRYGKKSPKVMLSAMSSIPRRVKSTIRPDDAPVTMRDLKQAFNAMETKMETKMTSLGIGLGGLMISLFLAGVVLVQRTISESAMKFDVQDSKIKVQDDLLLSRGKG